MAETLSDIGCRIWQPPDRRPPWAWAEEHIHSIPYSPVPGRFRADNSPWLKEPLEALVDPKVRIVSILAAIQSSKTTIGEIGLCYIIANLPGPALWLDQTDDDAKDQAESRLGRIFDECPAVQALYPRDRHKLKTSTKHFSNGMTLWVLGAHNKTNLQRRSIRWLIGDETWRWPVGHMAEAEARVTAFGWLGKCLFMSQGGEENDDTHRKFETTDMREWTFECPHCGLRQPFKWENVEWSKDARDDDGEWNFARVRETASLICEGCNHAFEDSDRTRRLLNTSGRYVRHQLERLD
jgi:phage terminase large subunit GpA-like protein